MKQKNIKEKKSCVRVIVLIIVLFFVFNLIPTLNNNNYGLSTSVQAGAGGSTYYFKNTTQVGSFIVDDVTDYFYFLIQTMDSGINFGTTTFINTYSFTGGHTYYFFINLNSAPAGNFSFNDIDVFNEECIFDYAYPILYRFRVYAVYFNSSTTIQIKITSNGNSAWPCFMYHNNTHYSRMILGTTSTFIASSSNYVSSWYAADTYFDHKPNGSVLHGVYSLDPDGYTSVKTLPGGSTSYNNFTATVYFFRGDIYNIIYVPSGVSYPVVTTTYMGIPYNSPIVYSLHLNDGAYLLFFRLTGLIDYNYAESRDYEVKINTAAGGDHFIMLPTVDAVTGMWAYYTCYMGGGVYSSWVNSSYLSYVRFFVYDVLGSLSNTLVIFNGIPGMYTYTDADGYTDYFTLSRNTLYSISMYDGQNNHYGFSFTSPPHATPVTIHVQFPTIVDVYVTSFLNSTSITTMEGNTHINVRYYYFLDAVNTYCLSIRNETNVLLYNKTLYSNTGYLDYFFRTPGTYYYNITNKYDNSLHNSDSINITDSYSNFYFYPQYTPFINSVTQNFFYYNNMSKTNMSISIPSINYVQYIDQGVEGYDNLSFVTEGQHNCMMLIDDVVVKKTVMSSYWLEYVGNLTSTINPSNGMQKIVFKHNFIGEGNTQLRVSDNALFTNILYSREISNAQRGEVSLFFQGENNTYFVDIYVYNTQIAILSINGWGEGDTIPPGPEPVGINPVWDLSSIIMSFGMDITAGYYLIGISIMVAFAILFLLLTGNGSAALFGSLLGCIVCLILGFLPLWVGVLLGVVSAAFIIFSFSGKLPSVGGGGGGAPPSNDNSGGGG